MFSSDAHATEHWYARPSTTAAADSAAGVAAAAPAASASEPSAPRSFPDDPRLGRFLHCRWCSASPRLLSDDDGPRLAAAADFGAPQPLRCRFSCTSGDGSLNANGSSLSTDAMSSLSLMSVLRRADHLAAGFVVFVATALRLDSSRPRPSAPLALPFIPALVEATEARCRPGIVPAATSVDCLATANGGRAPCLHVPRCSWPRTRGSRAALPGPAFCGRRTGAEFSSRFAPNVERFGWI